MVRLVSSGNNGETVGIYRCRLFGGAGDSRPLGRLTDNRNGDVGVTAGKLIKHVPINFARRATSPNASRIHPTGSIAAWIVVFLLDILPRLFENARRVTRSQSHRCIFWKPAFSFFSLGIALYPFENYTQMRFLDPGNSTFTRFEDQRR